MVIDSLNRMALYVIYRALHHVTVSDRINLVDPMTEIHPEREGG